MKIGSISKYPITLFCFFVLISSSLRLSSVFASKTCDFPAIFNFGASSSDTGGFAAAFTPPNYPYGRTYFHMPAGRFSDGRLIIDFIVGSFGLPYLNAYLDSLGTNFTHGANFATASSTIRLPKQIIPNGGFSPFYLDVQIDQLTQFKTRSQMIRAKGGVFANLMPKEEYFSKGLYTFDIGQNDLGAGFFANMSVEEVNASVPDIINKFSANIKNIYNNLGGRSFWIHNTGPIGCLPYIFVNFPSAIKDSVGCAKPYNDVAQNFNLNLKNAVLQLRKDFPSAAFTYVDIYSIKYSLFKEPNKYGFELPLVACCGYGEKYNFTRGAQCGQSVVLNGIKITVGSCDNPSVRVNWDGIHYTEAANKFVFDQISTGAFSDPPIPLKMACQ
ncbi:GDSL esterase/lipase [Melia azedarach]|uniref:GDSL esterase/lipase n=1 Tax=Melia azedarach TaxID=155640 RepID=A0ACC1WRV5_MELAZ|nr:GDSL esterase/lipase [Melia azedarach]